AGAGGVERVGDEELGSVVRELLADREGRPGA
ncbi:MAG: hypothetical protein QOD45_1586, partial [Pseudonocardiales bacterium]|nr:hypothetical protein [Pseudonocardiales bacterium]